MSKCGCAPLSWCRSIRAKLARRDVRRGIRILEARINECEQHAVWVESQLLELRCSVMVLTNDCQANGVSSGLTVSRLRDLVMDEAEAKKRLQGARRIVAALKRQRDVLVDSDLNSTVVHTLRDILGYLQSNGAGDVIDTEEVVDAVDDMQAETAEVTAILIGEDATVAVDHPVDTGDPPGVVANVDYPTAPSRAQAPLCRLVSMCE